MFKDLYRLRGEEGTKLLEMENYLLCSRTRHPSSLLLVGAGRAWVSAPPAPWCRTLVATGYNGK